MVANKNRYIMNSPRQKILPIQWMLSYYTLSYHGVEVDHIDHQELLGGSQPVG